MNQYSITVLTESGDTINYDIEAAVAQIDHVGGYITAQISDGHFKVQKLPESWVSVEAEHVGGDDSAPAEAAVPTPEEAAAMAAAGGVVPPPAA